MNASRCVQVRGDKQERSDSKIRPGSLKLGRAVKRAVPHGWFRAVPHRVHHASRAKRAFMAAARPVPGGVAHVRELPAGTSCARGRGRASCLFWDVHPDFGSESATPGFWTPPVRISVAMATNSIEGVRFCPQIQDAAQLESDLRSG